MSTYTAERIESTRRGRWGRRTTAQRLFAKVFINFETQCWDWQASIQKGYGTFWLNGSSRLAHRVTWEMYNGPADPELVLDHLCLNTRCVNPNHLEQVTDSENSRRMHAAVGSYNSKKTHCPEGHPYAGDNLMASEDGKRRGCRECHRKSAREHMRRRRAAAKLAVAA